VEQVNNTIELLLEDGQPVLFTGDRAPAFNQVLEDELGTVRVAWYYKYSFELL